MNGDGLGERRGAAVHVFDGFAELIGFDFGHAPIYHGEMAAATPLGGYRQRGLTRYDFFARSFRTAATPPFDGSGGAGCEEGG